MNDFVKKIQVQDCCKIHLWRICDYSLVGVTRGIRYIFVVESIDFRYSMLNLDNIEIFLRLHLEGYACWICCTYVVPMKKIKG